MPTLHDFVYRITDQLYGRCIDHESWVDQKLGSFWPFRDDLSADTLRILIAELERCEALQRGFYSNWARSFRRRLKAVNESPNVAARGLRLPPARHVAALPPACERRHVVAARRRKAAEARA